jgi:PAS domain S-box-containing protein
MSEIFGSPPRAVPTDAPSLIRLRRRAMAALTVVLVVITAAICLIAGLTATPTLFIWAAVGIVSAALLAIQVMAGSDDLRPVVVLHAAAVPFIVTFAPVPIGSVPGVLAALVMSAVLVFSISPRTRLTGIVGVLVLATYGFVAYAKASGPGGLVGAAALIGAAVVAWRVLDSLVGELREGEDSYRHLFDRVPVGLYRTAVSGEILDANHALGEILGYARHEVIGVNALDLLEDPEDLGRLRSQLSGDIDQLTTDVRFRRADGELIWIRDRTRVILDQDGQILCFEGELQDVTEERRHLEELESLVRSKSELIGAVSHEIRTPLTAVVGFLDLVLDGSRRLDPEHSELLSMASEQAYDVAGIVEDLLTAARIDNHELVVHMESIDVLSAINAAVRSLGVTGSDDFSVDADSGLAVMADGGRVRQIIRNLAVNATRYGAPPIRVSARATPEGVEIIVADRGTAIPSDVADRIFEAFYSGTPETSQPGSIGLGLSVSRRLARLMGGSLDHRRVAGETQFVLTLQAASQHEHASSAAAR